MRNSPCCCVRRVLTQCGPRRLSLYLGRQSVRASGMWLAAQRDGACAHPAVCGVRRYRLCSKPKHDRVQQVVAGHQATVCLDANANYWIAGRTRITGDGGLGQSFYIYKPLPALEELNVRAAALGKDALYCLASDLSDGAPILAYAWGQGASHGELGVRRAPADPQPLTALRELSVVHVASAAATSFWLVKPNKAYTNLPRLPRETHSSDACLVCHSAQDDDEATLLACDRCENPYHLGCLDPPLPSVPDGEWFCLACGGNAPEQGTAPQRKRRRPL